MKVLGSPVSGHFSNVQSHFMLRFTLRYVFPRRGRMYNGVCQTGAVFTEGDTEMCGNGN